MPAPFYETERAALVAGGWVRVGPFFRTPDDLGPSAKKWKTSLAYEEFMKLKAVQLAEAAAKRAVRRKAAAKGKAPTRKPS